MMADAGDRRRRTTTNNQARARTLAHAIGSAAAERYRETTLPAGTAHTHTHVAMLLALYAANELGGFIFLREWVV